MKEFFGINGYMREPEGYLSWQHITFVTTLLILAFLLSAYLGRRNKNKDERTKNRVLIVAGITTDLLEIALIVRGCALSDDPLTIFRMLPFFLCSIQLITIPLAAFSRGRVREAALDFVLLFGVLAAVLGNFGAGQNYSAYPVLSFNNVQSGLTHSISGFCAVYIGITGMSKMKKRNIPVCFGIVTAFCVVGYILNHLVDYNYMFLMRGDGTPYDLFYNLVNGSPVFYPILVVLMFYLYIFAFYFVYYRIAERISKKKAEKGQPS